jgi:hypothetical protein
MVTKQGTGEPLSRATIVLIPQPGGVDLRNAFMVRSVTTLGDGRFTFDDVPPGRYQLSATRDGYAPAEFGGGGPNGCGTVITLEGGRPQLDLSITMIPAGVIAGRLYDRDGEAASNVTVQALKYVYQNGRRVLSSVQSAQTNDLGEYRLFWLPPARYLVAAALEDPGNRGLNLLLEMPGVGQSSAPTSVPLPSAPAARTIVGGTSPAALAPGPRIVPVYYPGSPDPKAGRVIELRSGETFQGADMLVTRVQTRSIKGNIRSTNSVGTPQRLAVFLFSRIAQPNGEGALRSVTVLPDGSFELPSVIPGSYVLLAAGNDGTGRLSGRAVVDVGEVDLQNVEIVVSRGFELTGRVSMDDLQALGRIQGVSLQALSDSPAIRNVPLSAKLTEGAFRLEGIPPGDYQAYVSFTFPFDIYVKSMRLGSTDVRNGFRLDAQPVSQLEIVVGNNGAVLEGIVVGNSGRPSRGATVVLVPDVFLRSRSSSYKTATTDASGAFRISAIGPGDYKVFAWEEVERGAWEDADFLRAYETRGQALTLREGTEQTIQLLAIPSNGPIYGQCQAAAPR